VHGQIGDNSVAVCNILRKSLCELQTLRRSQLVRKRDLVLARNSCVTPSLGSLCGVPKFFAGLSPRYIAGGDISRYDDFRVFQATTPPVIVHPARSLIA